MLVLAFTPKDSHAASQNACAIWLCLPGGFPSGCGGAYREFKSRIKKGRAPLPRLSSCSSGTSRGRFEMGVEYYHPCEKGYVLRMDRSSVYYARCYAEACAPAQYEGFTSHCPNQEPQRRQQPNYIELWVDGDYLGKHFYTILR